MLVTGLGVTEDERMEDLRASQIAACEKKKEYLMNYSASPRSYAISDAYIGDSR